MLALRILASFTLFLSILFLPFWCTVVFAIAAVFLFEKYYEVFFLFLFADALYGFEGSRFGKFTLLYFVLAIVLYTLSVFIKKTYAIHSQK